MGQLAREGGRNNKEDLNCNLDTTKKMTSGARIAHKAWGQIIWNTFFKFDTYFSHLLSHGLVTKGLASPWLSLFALLLRKFCYFPQQSWYLKIVAGLAVKCSCKIAPASYFRSDVKWWATTEALNYVDSILFNGLTLEVKWDIGSPQERLI